MSETQERQRKRRNSDREKERPDTLRWYDAKSFMVVVFAADSMTTKNCQERQMTTKKTKQGKEASDPGTVQCRPHHRRSFITAQQLHYAGSTIKMPERHTSTQLGSVVLTLSGIQYNSAE